MTLATHRFASWAPRVFALCVIGFLSLFALDAFEEKGSLVRILTGFVIHLVPSMILVLVLVLAWRRPWIGALMFGMAALGYALSAGRAHLDWIAFISGPLLLTAVLFFLSWIVARRERLGAAV